jgi:hypothetical protein
MNFDIARLTHRARCGKIADMRSALGFTTKS